MSKIFYSTNDILGQISELQYVSGPHQNIFRVNQPDIATNGDLVFVSNQAQLDLALSSQASAVVIHAKILSTNSQPTAPNKTILSCAHVQSTMASTLRLFDRKLERFQPLGKIHPTAIVSSSATVAQSATIGPYAIIGDEVEIGENCIIGAHCVVETEAQIGEGTLLHPHVHIGAQCTIGAHCEIHPHTTIGSDGYGFASSRDGHKKVPQIGNVVIGDHVEIGSNCAIDRATLTSTTIGSGTKMDNLCHIAHNVQIGKGCLITAGFTIAGSSKIGDFFICGGRTGVADHVNICANVMAAGATIFTRDITEPGEYGGFPATPMKTYLKNQVAQSQLQERLSELRKQLKKIMAHLNIDMEA